jgi:polyribonucleotide nucleotidyltransferase
MQEVKDKLAENEELSASDIDTAVEYVARKIMRTNILKEEKRTSGRQIDELRSEVEVGVLPRVHGSLFSEEARHNVYQLPL